MKRLLAIFCTALIFSACANQEIHIENFKNLSSFEIESKLSSQHPSGYYEYAHYLWMKGNKEQAVFWLYAGQLRYRFYLSAKPQDPSGDPALFSALQDQVGEPINLYAGRDPDNWIKIINNVLTWDANTNNGFTSKSIYKKKWEETRAGLLKMRDYIDSNREDMRKAREQNGIGENGMVNGVYVEERNEKMPKEWPELLPNTTLQMIAGSYEPDNLGILGRILFTNDDRNVIHATVFDISVAQPDKLITVAKKGGAELSQATVNAQKIGDAIVFKEQRSAKEDGLAEGSKVTTISLRKNKNGDLVIQREYITEGKKANGLPVRLSYTFWNKATATKK